MRTLNDGNLTETFDTQRGKAYGLYVNGVFNAGSQVVATYGHGKGSPITFENGTFDAAGGSFIFDAVASQLTVTLTGEDGTTDIDVDLVALRDEN